MAARAIGTATISFGLVSIPSKVYTTNQTGSAIRFRMMHPDCAVPLKQQYIRPDTMEKVDRAEMVKGYEFAKGQFVKFTKAELKALEAVSDNTINLKEFVPASSVDSLYYDSTYYIAPDKGGDRSYQLLREALVQTDLVAVGEYSTRGRMHAVVLRPFSEHAMVLHQLRFSDEVRGIDDVPLATPEDASEDELDLAIKIIEQRTNQTFDLEKYHDTVKERVLAMVQEKVDGNEISVAPEVPQGQVIDLMEALKASLDEIPRTKPGKNQVRSKKAKKKTS